MTARIVGALVLAAFLVYGVGSSIATATVSAPGYLASVADDAMFTMGVVMMIANSAVVISIGVLMYPVLKERNANIALGYFGTRVFEGTFLAIGAISMLSIATIGRESAQLDADMSEFDSLAAAAISDNFTAYNVAMAGLGIGSLFFCYLLFQSRLVPRFLAVWGFAGYALFAAGCLLEIFGFSGVGLVLTIPGGLFEVFFGIWLIAKGFNPAAVAELRVEKQAVLVS